MNKDEVYEEVKKRAEVKVREFGMMESGTCLVWAVVGALVLMERGVRALFQAGSAGWPRIRPEQDDGKPTTCTHFSYMWTPDEPVSRRNIVLGLMPEMHCWIGLPATHELVDFTTGMFPVQARKIGGFDWPGDLPPLYFWGKSEDVGRAFYDPNLDAIKTGLQKTAEFFGIQTVKKLLEVR